MIPEEKGGIVKKRSKEVKEPEKGAKSKCFCEEGGKSFSPARLGSPTNVPNLRTPKKTKLTVGPEGKGGYHIEKVLSDGSRNTHAKKPREHDEPQAQQFSGGGKDRLSKKLLFSEKKRITPKN